MKYIKDGERFEVPINGFHRISCCDCGLTHDFAFILDGGRLELAAWQNRKETAKNKKKLKRRKKRK